MKPNNYFKICLFLTVFIISCDNDSKPEKVFAQYEPFIGTWKFISLYGQSTGGDIFLPYGENLFGRLMYDSKGYMSVLLMKPGRPKFTSGDMLNGTQEEIKVAFENFDAYCGTYKVDANKKTVTHFIEGSRFPNWEGTKQVRYYEFTDDTLKLNASVVLKEKEWALKAILVKL